MTMHSVGIDWGTSRFRAWAFDHDGAVLGAFKSDQGMARLSKAAFPEICQGALRALNLPEMTPVVICGMAGARGGWVEVPYLDTPTQLHHLAQSAARIDCDAHPVHILPGLSEHGSADVMRGEETLLLGADLTDAHVCIPGTHSKWVSLRGGEVTDFQTIMTGEVFASLRALPTLTAFLEERQDLQEFDEGVQIGFKTPGILMKQLFKIRAKPLLFERGSFSLDYLSGLLIGAEISNSAPKKKLTLIASAALSEIYQNAFKCLGLGYDLLDADKCAQRGLFSVAQKLYPESKKP